MPSLSLTIWMPRPSMTVRLPMGKLLTSPTLNTLDGS